MKPTKKTRRIDHAERLIAAPLVDVFAAFTSAAKLARWLPPEGATGTFEHIDLSAGGGFLMRLTFDDADVEAVIITASGCAVTRGQESVGAYVDDTAITTAVKARFIDNKLVDAAAIQALMQRPVGDGVAGAPFLLMRLRGKLQLRLQLVRCDLALFDFLLLGHTHRRSGAGGFQSTGAERQRRGKGDENLGLHELPPKGFVVGGLVLPLNKAGA